ncbi:MAG: hypothetical protein HYR94_08700 [Chloroflexi bacterium]|nr:hypothetical protein [Chloroflexota bacterium]
MAESSLKEFLLKLNKNYLILKEREAKYATAAPLDLLNQIDDYEHALELAQEAIDQNVPLDVLQVEFDSLNLDLRVEMVVFVSEEPPRKPFTGRNPYRGLRKFTEDEAEFFFGRNAAIQSLLDTIKQLVDAETSRELPDLVTVLGPSGSGKSSLVRAGLIPALQQGRLPGSEHWFIKVMVPNVHPLDEVAAQFVEPTGRGLPAVRADLNTGEKALHQLMLESLTRAGKPEDAVFVLVMDQFEELFTLCEDEAERQAFLAQLLYVSRTRRNRGLIILTMRADFYGKAAAYKRLADVITLNQMLVSPMTDKELREAILLPAEAVGLELEKALVETLLNDTAKAPGVLPLLQHTLQELFNQRDGNLLTLEAYRAMGGVKGALAHRADAILDSMPMPQRHIVRRIFMRLIQPEEGAVATRRRATFNEVLTEDSEASEVEAVVQILTDANLIVAGRNEETGEILLDVTHEALLEEWPRFQSWLDYDRQGLRIRQQLSLAAQDWEGRKRDNDSLYRGARLLEAEEWVAKFPGEINPLEQAFFEASQAARNRAEAEKRKRTRWLIRGLTVGLILVALGAVYGLYGQYQAERSKATAQAERASAQTAEAIAGKARVTAVAGQELAQQAEGTAEARRVIAEQQSQIALAQSLASLAPPIVERTHNTELAALLAVEAVYLNDTAHGNAQALVDNSLRSILSAPYFNVVLNGQGANVYAVAISPVLSDGRQFLASGSDDGAVWLWSMTDPSAGPTELREHKAGVRSVAFSPDGLTLASGSDDHTVRLWSVTNPSTPAKVLGDHLAGVRAVAFSPDGQTLASAGDDRTIRLWNLAQPAAELEPLQSDQLAVFTIAFSPDGQTLASAGEDPIVRLWNLAQPAAEPVRLQDHQGAVFSVAFSPDGQTLASAGFDKIIRLWDMTNPSAKPKTLEGYHEESISSVAFSPDGQLLASASQDFTVRLWPVAGSPTEPAILKGHTGKVWSVAFNPGGQSLASASADGTIRLWEMGNPSAEPIVYDRHLNSVEAVAFSPNGQLLASASDDGTVKLWRVADPATQQPTDLSGHGDIVRAVAFSSDGQTLASGSGDQTIRLWQVANPTADPAILPGHQGAVVSVAFSPDGQTLASASTDGTIRLWDWANSTTATAILPGHEGGVSSVAFSPDGQTLASAGFDQTIRLWRMADFVAKPLLGINTNILSLAFSPNGQSLAAAGDDGIIRLWNVADLAAEPIMLRGHESGVRSVAFSPTGQTLASASVDSTIRLWDVSQPAAEPIVLRGQQGTVFSVAFNQNGQTLASGGADRTVLIRKSKCNRLYRRLSKNCLTRAES